MRSIQSRCKTTMLIGMRGFLATLRGLGFHIVALSGCAVMAMVAASYVGIVAENGLIVLANPLNNSLYFAMIIGAIYLASAAAIAISREREAGTLEVLFYGPVDHLSVVLAKYIEQILVFLVLAASQIASAGLLNLLTGFGFSIWMLSVAGLYVMLASSLVSYGIFLSTMTGGIRTSILGLIGTIGFFLALKWAAASIAGFAPLSVSPVVLYARSFLSSLISALDWLSPLTYLDRGLLAVAVNNHLDYLTSLGYSLLFTVVFLASSGLSLGKRGVRIQ